jgi:hypothetical protein
VVSSSGQSPGSPDLIQFAFVDSASLEYVNKKQNLPVKMGETAAILLSSMSSQQLASLRQTSKQAQFIAEDLLIHRLNSKEIGILCIFSESLRGWYDDTTRIVSSTYNKTNNYIGNYKLKLK